MNFIRNGFGLVECAVASWILAWAIRTIIESNPTFTWWKGVKR